MTTHVKDLLRHYKTMHGLTYVQLASLFGCSPHYVRKLGSGTPDSVSRKLASRIERATNGEIAAVDLIFGPAKGRKRS